MHTEMLLDKKRTLYSMSLEYKRLCGSFWIRYKAGQRLNISFSCFIKDYIK